MALVKCPRCELNYMQDTDRYCTVCRREMRGEEEREEVDLCPECGEHPVVPGEEMCAFCIKEMKRQELAMAGDDPVAEPVTGEEVVELDAASGMDEIDIEDDEDIPTDEYKEINRELQDDDEGGIEIIDLDSAILEEEMNDDDEDDVEDM